MVGPKAKRKALEHLRATKGLSIRSGCQLLGLQTSTYHYKPYRQRDDSALREKMKELAQSKTWMGRPMMIWTLREKLKWPDNHKRISRIYREENLQIGKRPKKKRRSSLRLVLETPSAPNQVWAMDFIHDQLETGRRFRCLTVRDLYTREAVCIWLDHSIPGDRVASILDWLKLSRSLPRAIIVDNGTEFTSRAMDQWAYRNSVELKFIQPGKPIQNAFIESFNGTLRRECLNQHWFSSLEEARAIIEKWRVEYNTERPVRTLGNKIPFQVAEDFKKCVNQ